MARQPKSSPKPKNEQFYKHPDANPPGRLEIGAQKHFKRGKQDTFLNLHELPAVEKLEEGK